MKKAYLLIAFLGTFFLAGTTLTSCNDDDDDVSASTETTNLVGTWISDDGLYKGIFRADGTCTLYNYTEGFFAGSGTYYTNNGMLYIHYSNIIGDRSPMDEESNTDTYYYTLSGNTLQISMDEGDHWDFVILYKSDDDDDVSASTQTTSLVGTWINYDEEFKIIFRADGTYYQIAVDEDFLEYGTYTITNETICFHFDWCSTADWNRDSEYELYYTLSGNTLQLRWDKDESIIFYKTN